MPDSIEDATSVLASMGMLPRLAADAPVSGERAARRPHRTLTHEQIARAATSAGGYTREQLAEWGIPWPPPRGWKRGLTEPRSPS